MILSRDIFLRELEVAYRELWFLASVIYGPNSSNALIQRASGCLFVNDGSTVLRELRSKNRLRASIESIIQQSALRTREECGDGTTTTLILTLVLIKEGMKAIAAGTSIPQLVSQLKKATLNCCSMLSSYNKPVEESDLIHLAMLSSKDEVQLSEHIVRAVLDVGEDGFISIEEGKGVEVTTQHRVGMKLPTIPCSHAFLSGEPKRTLEGCLVATVQTPMSLFEDVRDLLECASQWKDSPLIIVTTSYVMGVALDTILLNNSKGLSDCIVVHITENPEMRQESLRDIAALCGSEVVDPIQGRGLKGFQSEWLGTLRKATITQTDMIAVPYDEESGGRSWIEARIQELESSLNHSVGVKSEDYRRRIAQLDEGLCIIEVGATTEQERRLKLSKAENSIQFLNCALSKGVVIGGGNALAHCSHNMKISSVGDSIMSEALRAPIQVLNKRPVDLSQIDVREGLGWDCETGSLRNLLTQPKVITPTKVLECSITNAVSVATTLLLSEKVILK